MISQLDDKDRITAIDRSGMLSVVEGAAGQLTQAYRITPQIEVKKRLEGVVFAGMGGSAIAGDVLSDIFSPSLKKGMYVSRGYSLPASLDERGLFIAVSYSGNTEETLSGLKEAEERGMQVICVTSGGKLRESAMAKKHPLVDIPSGFQPRAAFYLIFSTLVRVLETIGWVPSQAGALSEAEQVIEGMRSEFGPQKQERVNEAKQIAQKIKGKYPVIFASRGTTEACGLRIKNQFNENTKVPAFLTVFPELNHNEMVGFADLKKGDHPLAMLLLRDEDEHVRVNKRIEITKSLVGMNLGGAHEIRARGKSRVAKALSLIFYGDLLSVYSAILRGTDPTPVDVIEKLKKELKR